VAGTSTNSTLQTTHQSNHVLAQAYPAHSVIEIEAEAFASDRQDGINARFEAEANYWKDVYQQPGVFEAIYQERQNRVLARFDQLRLPVESSLLEIGCGAGLTTVALAKRGYTVHAIDPVQPMLDMTLQLALDSGVGQRVFTAKNDVHRLAFADASFDAVLAIGVTPWLHSLPLAMREIARVLRPGGYLIVSADNRWRLNFLLDPRCFPGLASARRQVKDWMYQRVLRKAHSQQPRARMYSRRQFNSELGAAGLTCLGGETVGFGPFSFLSYRLLSDGLGLKIHNCLQSLADRDVSLLRSTGAQYIVVAQRPRQ
jgi:ubiquinone/menaquinone biosynthesis C-methylase UbiE